MLDMPVVWRADVECVIFSVAKLVCDVVVFTESFCVCHSIAFVAIVSKTLCCCPVIFNYKHRDHVSVIHLCSSVWLHVSVSSQM